MPTRLRLRRLCQERRQAERISLAKKHNQEQAIVLIPNEIFKKVFDELPLECRGNLRKTCSYFDERTLELYCQLFSTLPVHIYMQASLDHLQAISRSRVAPFVRRIVLWGYHLDRSSNAADYERVEDRFGSDTAEFIDYTLYRKRLKEQFWVTTYGDTMRIMAQALNSLPNCTTLETGAHHDFPNDYPKIREISKSLLGSGLHRCLGHIPLSPGSTDSSGLLEAYMDFYGSDVRDDEHEDDIMDIFQRLNIIEPPDGEEMANLTLGLFMSTTRHLEVIQIGESGYSVNNMHFSCPPLKNMDFKGRINSLRGLVIHYNVSTVNKDFVHFILRAKNLVRLHLHIDKLIDEPGTETEDIFHILSNKLRLPQLGDLSLAFGGLPCLFKASTITTILQAHAKSLTRLSLIGLSFEESFAQCVQVMAEEMECAHVFLKGIYEHCHPKPPFCNHICRHDCEYLKLFVAAHDVRAKLRDLAEKLSKEHDRNDGSCDKVLPRNVNQSYTVVY